MKNTFDLQKFLVENKITRESKMADESGFLDDPSREKIIELIRKHHPDVEGLDVEEFADLVDDLYREWLNKQDIYKGNIESYLKDLIDRGEFRYSLPDEGDIEEARDDRDPAWKWDGKPEYSRISNVEFEDVFQWDYPDFSDAYVSSADYDGEPMTDAELDELNEDRDLIADLLEDYLH